jgi:ubiquinone/menaquinone biosynthesis C-methylase UbiE
MDLWEVQKNWTIFGQEDPLWGILTDPSKKGNKWDPQDFFLTGKNEIDALFDIINKLNVPISYGKVLDFGCGVGRLTQAFASRFEECYGVDIASTMIENANKFNKFGERCKYFINESDNLLLFNNNFFDFIYSKIVLQHMEPKYSKKYIKEFLRVLKPGGMLIFQVPSKPYPPEYLDKNNENGYSSELKLNGEFGTSFIDTAMKVTVKVKNISNKLWLSPVDSNYRVFIALGNHWLDKNQRVIINDDGRTLLPKSLAPQEEIDLDLMVKTPKNPGISYLELDLVQEGVTWFKNKGSKTIIKPIKIIEQNAQFKFNSHEIARINEKTEPVMESHGIEKYEVINLINDNGGCIINIENDYSTPFWESYLYFITK